MRDLLYQLVDRRWTQRLLTHTPVDLLAVAGFVVLTVALFETVGVASTALRTVIGLPLLFFAPGYVVVAVFFPRAVPERPGEDDPFSIRQTRSVSGLERAALSFGLSVAVVPLLGLAVAATSRGFTRPVVVRVVAGFVLLGVLVAALRRLRVPLADRYSPRYGEALESVRSAVIADSSRHTAVNLFLVASVLLALSSVGYALAAPQSGEAHSNLYVLTENDEGELVASGYPEEFTAGEPEEFAVSVENHEGGETSYELVVVVDRVDTGGGETRVVEREEVDRYEATIDDGQRWTLRHSIAPALTGEDLRVSYLLYEGAAPADPASEEPDEHVYFWTDVESS